MQGFMVLMEHKLVVLRLGRNIGFQHLLLHAHAGAASFHVGPTFALIK